MRFRKGGRTGKVRFLGDIEKLTNARFIGEPDLYRARIKAFLAPDLFQAGGKPFSKSSIAPAAWA